MDQDQGSDAEETAPDEGKQESEDQAQSTETKDSQGDKKGEKVFKDHFGNELTADQLYENYNKMVPNYTKVTQELADLRKQQESQKGKAGEDARKAVSENVKLQNVPPDVKEAIISIVTPVIEEREKQREAAQAERERASAFDSEIQRLEKQYDGKGGLPKFDKNKVLAKMTESGNRNYDPESVYLQLHRKEYEDFIIKQALKQQRGGSQTEPTGKGEPSKPEGKTPKTFEEAAKAAISRIVRE